MTWGIFKKTADIAKKVGQTVKNVVIPNAKKVVEFGKDVYEMTKPIIGETTWGKNIGKAIEYSDDVLDYAEDFSDVMNAKDAKTGIKRGIDLYQRSKQYK